MKKKRKVAIIPASFLPRKGGLEVLVHNFLIEVKNNNKKYKYDYFVLVGPRTYLKIFNKVDYKLAVYFSANIKSVANKLRKLKIFNNLLINRIEEFLIILDIIQIKIIHKASIYHFHNLKATDIISKKIFRKFIDKSIILTPHGSDVQSFVEGNYGYVKNKNNSYYEKLFLEKNVFLTYISSAIKKDVEKLSKPRYGEIIFNFTYKYPIEKKNIYLKKNKLIKIITLGRNHPKKNFKSINSIAESIYKLSQINFLWDISGRGCTNLENISNKKYKVNYFESFDQIKSSNGNLSINNFMPAKRNFQMISNYDFMIFPTFLEGLPLVIIEAMSCGVLVITTDAPGLEDINSVIKVDHKSKILPKLIAEKLNELINDKDLFNNILLRQYSEFAEKFTISSNIKRYEKLYDLCP